LKYIQTGQGFLFLAAVQDVFSRRIIGWSMRDDLKAELVLDALGMAVSVRGDQAAGDATAFSLRRRFGPRLDSRVLPGPKTRAPSGVGLARARSPRWIADL
jgi:transposase InsO family protein